MDELSAAQCPNHQYGQVTFTCVRCGTFGCNACLSPHPGPLCSACGARASAQGLPVVETLMESIQFLWKRPSLLGATIGVQVLFGLLSTRGASPKVSVGFGWLVLGLLFTTLLQVLIIRYMGDQLEDPERPLAETLQGALQRLPASLGASLLVGVVVALGCIACLLPGLFLFTVLCLALPAVVLHGAGASESLSISWQRTEEHRWQMLLVLLAAGGPTFLAGLAGAGFQVMLGRLSRTGALLGLLVNQTLAGLSLCLMTAVIVFSYLKLSGVFTGERQGE